MVGGTMLLGTLTLLQDGFVSDVMDNYFVNAANDPKV